MEQAWDSQFLDDRSGVPQRLLNLIAGAAISLGLFFALSLARHTTIEKPEAPVETLHSINLPDIPPPPPEPQSAEVTAASLIPFPTPIKGTSILNPSPSDSAIRIKATLPAMGPVVQPLAAPVISFTPGQFKPKGELAVDDPRQIYNTSDVDQPPVVLRRIVPEISTKLYESIGNPRVTIMFLVETDGKVSNTWMLRTSGNTEFDQLVAEAIKEWEFRPAIKRGKTVRCWVQQPIFVRLPRSNAFQL